MRITTLHLNILIIPPGLRALNEDAVVGLMKSFQEIGMQTPVTYYYNDDDDAVLVAGKHRVEAAKRLDWASVEGIEMDVGDTRELWAIDENLMRADLTELERTEHIARRKQFLDAKEKVKEEVKEEVKKTSVSNTATSFGSIKKGRGQPKGFDRTMADQMGVSSEKVRKSRIRGEKIIRKVKEQIKDMPVARSGVELDALATMKPHQQLEAVHQVKTGVAKDFLEAKTQMTKQTTTGKLDTIEVEFGHLKRVWHRAGITARKKFMKWAKEQLEGKAAGK